MSTSYHPIAMFGIKFQKSKDYYHFLSQNTQLAQLCNVSNLDDLDDHISYAVEEHLSPLKLERLDMCYTQDAILGFPMNLGETLDKYQVLWNQYFSHSDIKPEPQSPLKVCC